MKRLVAIAGAGAMLLSVATPAFALNFGPVFTPSYKTTNVAIVSNTANANSNTGYNTQTGKSGFIGTGVAMSGSTAVVVANTSAKDCNCTPKGDVTNSAMVGNTANASSNTGFNTQSSGPSLWSVGPGPAVMTGGAGSSASSWTVVNTSVSWK
jgi:hypothetical protein